MRVFRIPYASDGLRTGVEQAPDAVLAELERDTLTAGGVPPESAGVLLPDDAQDALDAIGQTLANAGRFLLVGGDHGLTFAAVKALAARTPGMGVLSLSARPDCHRPLGIPAREDWLRALATEGLVAADRMLVVGLRAAAGDELQWMRQHGVRTVEMRSLMHGPIEACDDIMEAARAWPAAYLSIDMDVLDPAFAPGVNDPEPGGLSTRELLGMVQRLRMLPNLAGCDIVECNPLKDPQGLTQKIAAKLLAELLQAPPLQERALEGEDEPGRN